MIFKSEAVSQHFNVISGGIVEKGAYKAVFSVSVCGVMTITGIHLGSIKGEDCVLFPSAKDSKGNWNNTSWTNSREFKNELLGVLQKAYSIMQIAANPSAFAPVDPGSMEGTPWV